MEDEAVSDDDADAAAAATVAGPGTDDDAHRTGR
jgi:hypothetical protein